MELFIRGGRFRQYLGGSFLGATPGCLGAFASTSLYIHGFISFGAIVATMVATSGDEAFVMLALFPRKAIFLFTLFFGVGILSGWIADKLALRLNLRPCEACDRLELHDDDEYRCLSKAIVKKNFRFS